MNWLSARVLPRKKPAHLCPVRQRNRRKTPKIYAWKGCFCQMNKTKRAHSVRKQYKTICYSRNDPVTQLVFPSRSMNQINQLNARHINSDVSSSSLNFQQNLLMMNGLEMNSYLLSTFQLKHANWHFARDSYSITIISFFFLLYHNQELRRMATSITIAFFSFVLWWTPKLIYLLEICGQNVIVWGKPNLSSQAN